MARKQITRVSADEIRAAVEGAAIRAQCSIEDYFERAARRHGEGLSPSEVQRKASRFKKGGGAPKFVQMHAQIGVAAARR